MGSGTAAKSGKEEKEKRKKRKKRRNRERRGEPRARKQKEKVREAISIVSVDFIGLHWDLVLVTLISLLA